MRPNDQSIRDFLVDAVGDRPGPWPDHWDHASALEAVGNAAIYHGVAGLLAGSAIDGWPESLADRIRDQARAQAMWELRHHLLLSALLPALADHQVPALLLKGSAIAYDLYERPAARSRGDSDLLVPRTDLAKARAVLYGLGFRRLEADDGLDDELGRQEAWTMSCDGGAAHCIDLHWEALNSHALGHVLPAEECFATARHLPHLSPAAKTLDRPRFLLHTCIHRAMHRTAPYFVGGKPHFDEGRLIWSKDVALLAAAMTPDEWQDFARLAVAKGVAGACLAGLRAARADFGAIVPGGVADELGSAAEDPYLHGSALERAWSDLRSVPGSRAKLRYLRGRLLPAAGFMRAKYPSLAGAPLIVLYARRLAESLRR